MDMRVYIGITDGMSSGRVWKSKHMSKDVSAHMSKHMSKYLSKHLSELMAKHKQGTNLEPRHARSARYQ